MGGDMEQADAERWFARAEGDVRRQEEAHGYRAVQGMTRSREETLGSWLGGERRAEVFAQLRPLHDDVGKLIDTALSGVNAGDALLLSRLEEHWAELWEASMVSQCRPLSVKDGHLKIEVKNSTLLYMLERQQKDMILRHLSKFTDKRILSIEFVPGGGRVWRR